ncbi:MAG: hypothetical protein JWN04_1548 [Myxococcaceae bacterium]|nr:hypothetical protein [Myxococcaceae bacterium]
MVKDIEDEDDELLELSDLAELSDDGHGNAEEIGLDDGEELGAGEIDEAPEDVGLDVETLGGMEAGEESFLDEDEPSTLDNAPLELDDDLEDEEDEDGWTVESEGTGAAFDEELADDEPEPEDDGGLEGIDDPSLDDFAEEGETSLSIEGDDLSADEELERVELDLG